MAHYGDGSSDGTGKADDIAAKARAPAQGGTSHPRPGEVSEIAARAREMARMSRGDPDRDPLDACMEDKHPGRGHSNAIPILIQRLQALEKDVELIARELGQMRLEQQELNGGR